MQPKYFYNYSSYRISSLCEIHTFHIVDLKRPSGSPACAHGNGSDHMMSRCLGVLHKLSLSNYGTQTHTQPEEMPNIICYVIRYFSRTVLRLTRSLTYM